MVRGLVQERHHELEEEEEATEISNKVCQLFGPWLVFPSPVVVEVEVQLDDEEDVGEGPQEPLNDQFRQRLQHSDQAFLGSVLIGNLDPLTSAHVFEKKHLRHAANRPFSTGSVTPISAFGLHQPRNAPSLVLQGIKKTRCDSHNGPGDGGG